MSTVPHTVWRLRLVAVCIGLMALAFSQQSGRVVADTKLDLTANPTGFLAKSLSLWDPTAALGQLQNQAYGYLFPMGSFFWVGDAIRLDAWVTQRLWWTLLLVVAFLGMWRLSGALTTASPWARMAGALAYALSPRLLAELTITSVEVWPMAVAPWVLWPLVDRAPRTWTWRITRSALAVACLGGVNAVASGAALILPALWFLTRRPELRTYARGLVWLAAAFAAMMWWLGPLLVLGRYSPPFLDWIEGIAVTSSTASVFESLRGTSAWLGFLLTTNGPSWPGGFLFVSQPALIIATVLVAAVGLVGLGLHSHVREPVFLAVSVIVGILLLTAGHQGATQSILSEPVRALLDGPLAALRNLHKFDLVIRIPLVLGLVAAVEAGARTAARLRLVPLVAPLAVCLGLVSLSAPAIAGQLARPEAYTSIPSYWEEAAAWLDSQPPPGAVLVLPAASFLDFEWGSTKDNPLQALSSRPFVHRDAVPLGSAGATRLLDGIEAEMGSGRGGEHMRRVLATAGIRYVLVPNDLRLDAAGDDLVRIHSAIEKSGLPLVAAFGPEQATWLESSDQTVNYGTVLSRPRIEVFDVGGNTATISRSADLPRVHSAAPENLVALSRDAGVDLALFDGDGADLLTSEERIVMDGRTAREVDFGRVTHNRSHLLAGRESPSQDRPVTDYVVAPGWPRTTQGWDGVAGISASSAASQASATLRLGPGYGPAAAVDGATDTGWVSGTFGRAVGEWLQLDFEGPTSMSTVTVTVLADRAIGATPRLLSFETENGKVSATVFPNGRAEAFVKPGVTRWLRITLQETTPGPQNGFGIAEIAVDDRVIRPRTQVPGVGDAATILLRRDIPGTPRCVYVGGRMRCDPNVDPTAEEQDALRRTVVISQTAPFTASGWVSERPGDDIDALLTHPDGIEATASSRLVAGSPTRPGAAVDGNALTGWVAGDGDLTPSLVLELPEERTVSYVRLHTAAELRASRPVRISVRFDDGTKVAGRLDSDGVLKISPRLVSRATVTIREAGPVVSIDAATGVRSIVPVGVSEVTLGGAEDLNLSLPGAFETGAPCGFGPTLVVNGQEVDTRVVGSINAVESGRPLRWETCGPDSLVLPRGPNTIDLLASTQFRPDTIVLQKPGAAAASQPAVATLDRPTRTSLRLRMDASPETRVVAVAQNYSPGWRATDDTGDELAAVRVNGWMQGWVVPAGVRDMSALFVPQNAFRAALWLGALMLGGLMTVAATDLRRREGQTRRLWTVPPPPAQPAMGVAMGGILLAFVITGGWWALLVAGAVCSMMAVFRGRPRMEGLQRALVLALLLAGAAAASITPWPTGQGNVDSVAVALSTLSGLAFGLGLALTGSRSVDRDAAARDGESATSA
jgi:arabinofuranan 3-O-arabinosyltransferase